MSRPAELESAVVPGCPCVDCHGDDDPAVERLDWVPRVLAERKLRCGAPRYEPGGGGVNVARAIRMLGGEAVALFPAGGPAGRLIDDLLSREGVARMAVPIAGWTRENLNVFEEETGRQFRFVLPGPTLAAGEWSRCLEVLAALDPFPAFLVASGEPASGSARGFLRAPGGVGAGPQGADVPGLSRERRFPERPRRASSFCKPSLREFQEWTGAASADEPRLRELAREVLAKGWCEVLVLSLGSGGALWTTRSEQERLTAPAVPVSSSVGAGDSLVAGIVLSLCRGRPLREAVRFGVAAAAAAVMNPGTQLCRREDAERLFDQVVAAPV